MNRPGFFLIGAPKCGTSALAHYLSEHPQVCFSYPKEPYYWADDFPGIQKQFGILSLDLYLQMFSGIDNQRSLGGEGSTLYLASKNAVPRILEFQPDARFIVMLRNPADIVVSAHLQELSFLNEVEPSFVKAWQLQETRKQGHLIPASCYEPALLQYRSMAQLGFQVDRLFKTVSRDRVQVIFFEDFQSSLPDLYNRVLTFLGLRHDGRTTFPRINDAKIPRYRWVTKLLNGRTGTAVSRFLKQQLPGPVGAIAERGKKLLANKRVLRTPLPPEFAAQLRLELEDDIRLLAEQTGRDLAHWYTVPKLVQNTSDGMCAK